MRKILSILLILCAFLAGGCSVEDDDLWCTVTFNAVLPDGSTFETMIVDMAPQGNFFRNINNLYEYDIASFVGGKSSQRILKGMYLISFDAVCVMDDGSRVKVRCADHNSPNTAIDLTSDAETVTLKLLKLK